MQTGHLILKDLSEKLEEMGPDYMSLSLTSRETSYHLAELDKSLHILKTQRGIQLADLQNLIIRAARLIESFQADQIKVEEEQERQRKLKEEQAKKEEEPQKEETTDEKPKTTSKRGRPKK
jgi:hypothetical protein